MRGGAGWGAGGAGVGPRAQPGHYTFRPPPPEAGKMEAGPKITSSDVGIRQKSSCLLVLHLMRP